MPAIYCGERHRSLRGSRPWDRARGCTLGKEHGLKRPWEKFWRDHHGINPRGRLGGRSPLIIDLGSIVLGMYRTWDSQTLAQMDSGDRPQGSSLGQICLRIDLDDQAWG